MSPPAAIVPAGGGSRRMAVPGGPSVDKAAIEVEGVVMLDRVLAAARPLCGRLVVVVGPARATVVAGVEFVQEPTPGGGPAAAVAAGLAALGPGTEVVLVLAADLPLLTPADLGRLLDRLAAQPAVDAVAALDHRGRPHPLLAAYRAAAVDVTGGPGSPAAGLLPERVATVDLGPEATLNVNTAADLEAAVAVLRSRGTPPSTRSSSSP